MSDASWTEMAEEQFVSLTTFRRDGSGVATPVWAAPDGEGALVVTTPADSYKVRRLRRDPRVELRPCSRRGRVADDAPVLAGVAEVRQGREAVDAAHRVLREKYGVQVRLVLGVEWLMRRGHTDRVIVRVTPAP
ncbi:PPOX class F420-dependent oxidoreductase [Phycicoccus sp. CSK15P-2]|uniref:PPOX class F420-dependent oxidoreductase n=1 Tax=Phycicoccus sp. CSK15P-2 TaxID=2807627 RepID=UPI00194FF67B|nr:PPOX class F420-dependent oxidoreductase [Phycicoccus sp. CSK15P-2]MBM6403859.1 PPOX class F420-dependent oxidoreductase [Phycicoccus sp. CSK15P-2]